MSVQATSIVQIDSDTDVGLGEADSETSPKKKSKKKAFQDMLHRIGGKLIQLMHTTMVPEQVKTQKIQVGVQVSRLEDKDVIFSIGSALDVTLFCLYLYLIGTFAFNVSEDTLNRFKVRGFGSLLEAGTKADTKHDIEPTCHDDVVVLKNSETEEEDVKEDESDHNKERYTFEDDDDDGEFDDLD
ncbi:hypothetical protein Tco_1020079 [Tanacetum coccineum]|uniref:Uncharacterized protein n=1 Tax=Tanacetum coccineum TaxID=301880 RepID=A0ABQ5G0N8_9ASTR